MAIDKAKVYELLNEAVAGYIQVLLEERDEEFRAVWKAWTDLDRVTAAGVFSETLVVGGKPGEAQRAFVALAKTLAALAFVPAGVSFGPLHFEARREPKKEEAHEEAQ